VAKTGGSVGAGPPALAFGVVAGEEVGIFSGDRCVRLVPPR